MARNVTDKYQTQQILSASPAKLVAMLLGKAISSLHEAIRAIEAGEIEERWRANSRAMEIVNHLWSTLDMEQGGEIAANLDQLYRFIIRLLPDVDMKNDPKPARDVIGLLEPLRRSWETVAAQQLTEARGQAPAGSQPGAAPHGSKEAPADKAPPLTGLAISA